MSSQPAALLRSAMSTFRRFALFAVVLALLPATASAADSIYWGNECAGTIRSGTWTARAPPRPCSSSEGGPCGVAIDPAAGKIYWANFNSGKIRVANLDGSGTASTLFDDGRATCAGWRSTPRTTRSTGPTRQHGTIRVGNLDGSGTASTLFTDRRKRPERGGDRPRGRQDLLDQPVHRRGPGREPGRLGHRLDPVRREDNPIGVAIDPAAGKIYWTDLGSRHGPGPGGTWTAPGTASTLFGGESGPGGVAIDPAAGKIYWVNFFGGAIRVGNLDGSGTASTLFGAARAARSSPRCCARRRAPGLRAISGGEDRRGAQLQPGDWAPDLLGAFLFRAPPASPISGCRTGTRSGRHRVDLHAHRARLLHLRVTASNHAGSASQTSSVKKVKDK